jgi:hypothetical protein
MLKMLHRASNHDKPTQATIIYENLEPLEVMPGTQSDEPAAPESPV